MSSHTKAAGAAGAAGGGESRPSVSLRAFSSSWPRVTRQTLERTRVRTTTGRRPRTGFLRGGRAIGAKKRRALAFFFYLVFEDARRPRLSQTHTQTKHNPSRSPSPKHNPTSAKMARLTAILLAVLVALLAVFGESRALIDFLSERDAVRTAL
jgi:hypothetical protein